MIVSLCRSASARGTARLDRLVDNRREFDRLPLEYHFTAAVSADVQQVVDEANHLAQLTLHRVASCLDHFLIAVRTLDNFLHASQRRERSSKFMSQRGQEIIFLAVSASKLLHERIHFLLRLLFHGDVHGDARHVGIAVTLILDRFASLANPPHRAVRQDDSDFGLVKSAPINGLLERLDGVVAIIRVYVCEWFADNWRAFTKARTQPASRKASVSAKPINAASLSLRCGRTCIGCISAISRSTKSVRSAFAQSRGLTPLIGKRHAVRLPGCDRPADLLLIRLQGVLTAAEQQLVRTLLPEKGRDLLKQVRIQLIETARPALEAIIQEITQIAPISLHHDISTVTGEEVILFVLAEAPEVRELKRK